MGRYLYIYIYIHARVRKPSERIGCDKVGSKRCFSSFNSVFHPLDGLTYLSLVSSNSVGYLMPLPGDHSPRLTVSDPRLTLVPAYDFKTLTHFQSVIHVICLRSLMLLWLIYTGAS